MPPSPDAARERRDEIAPLLERAQRAYHSGSEPILTNEHYDRLVHELRDIESAFPHLAAGDSPAQRVGAPAAAGFAPGRLTRAPASSTSASNIDSPNSSRPHTSSRSPR